jgi:membrane carboxypeptidase/penicillin-binding protein PbpC
MQLARLLWQLNTRTPGASCSRWRAMQLELFYSKQQILEAYLNDAPYGRNVEGVGAASLAYFDKPAGSSPARGADAGGDSAGSDAAPAPHARRPATS